MIGPSTWRAIAWTASKSPGLVIGKPASMTSTPSRASWWAISSFSDGLSEIPGDCSPSRRVVSKTCTRSMGQLLVLGLGPFLRLSSRLRGRHAFAPPRGGGAGEGKGRDATARAPTIPIAGQQDLVAAEPVRRGHLAPAAVGPLEPTRAIAQVARTHAAQR